MENELGQFAQIAAALAATLYAFYASNGLMNLFLRHIDRLSIDREDVRILARYARLAVLWAGVAGLFRLLPFFMATCFLMCVVVLFQVWNADRTLKKIEKN